MSNRVMDVDEIGKFLTQNGVDVKNKPAFPANQDVQRNVALIERQARKLSIAHNNGDIVAALDALCDLVYVTGGCILEFGFKDCMIDALNEVHEANMNKKNFRADSNRNNKELRLKLVEVVNRKTMSAVDYSPNTKPGPKEGTKVSSTKTKKAKGKI